MEAGSAIFSDNRAQPHSLVADSGVAEKPRRKSRARRRRSRPVEAKARSAEHELHIEAPFTIWDRANPDTLIDPNAPAEPAGEIASESKPKKSDTLKGEKSAEITAKLPGEKQSSSSGKSEISAAKHEKAAEEIPKRQNTQLDSKNMKEITNNNDQEKELMPEAAMTQPQPDAQDGARNFFWNEPEVTPPQRDAAEMHDTLPPIETDVQQPAPEAPAAQQSSELANEESEHLRRARMQVGEQLDRVAPQAPEHAAITTNEQKPAGSEVEPPQTVEAQKPIPEMSTAPERQVDMTREDLLAIGNSITFESVSLSEMFRAKRVDEEGLRRVVSAFLRGEDVRKILASEIVRFQMRFERDPRLRDNLAPRRSGPSRTGQAAKKMAGHTKTALNPQRMKHGAVRLSDGLVSGYDRARGAAAGNPDTAKKLAIAGAVVAYFVILIIIIRA